MADIPQLLNLWKNLNKNGYDVRQMKEEKKLVRFDWAIKYLLRNKVNFVVLEGFLSELIGQAILIEDILESESGADAFDDKVSRVDLMAKLSDGERVLIEVQCSQQWNYLSRMLFGVSRTVIDTIKRGDGYDKTPRVIAVHVVYFDLGEGQDYIYEGKIEFRGRHYHDLLKLAAREQEKYAENIREVSDIFPNFYLIKVNRFNARINDKFDEWVYFLQNAAAPARITAQGLSEASECLDILKLSKDAKKAMNAF